MLVMTLLKVGIHGFVMGMIQNNYLHMNWGWGGYSDGFFQVDSLTTPGFDPSSVMK